MVRISPRFDKAFVGLHVLQSHLFHPKTKTLCSFWYFDARNGSAVIFSESLVFFPSHLLKHLETESTFIIFPRLIFSVLQDKVVHLGWTLSPHVLRFVPWCTREDGRMMWGERFDDSWLIHLIASNGITYEMSGEKMRKLFIFMAVKTPSHARKYLLNFRLIGGFCGLWSYVAW